MPGFALAVLASSAAAEAPAAEGLVLHKHGIFSWGDDAETAYERMIALVPLAEGRLARGRRSAFPGRARPERLARGADVAPIRRAAAAIARPDRGGHRRFVLAY